MNQEQRKKAIAWLKEEIRSLERAPELNGCGPENWADLLEIMKTCLEAVQDHFPDTTKMIPLTMKQLREMRGEWVWLVTGGEDKATGWAFVSKGEVNTFLGYDSDKYTVKATFDIEECGKEFFAYDYPPAHIDRESWKCHVCFSALDTFAQKKFGFRYCKNCGRPLTPETWAELEKRLRGVHNG